jgi:hypothetical protein
MSALVGWLRAIVSGSGRGNELRGINRAEFEQIARDLNLSALELYGLSTGRQLSGERLEARLAECECSQQHARGRQALEHERPRSGERPYLPIGPSCC